MSVIYRRTILIVSVLIREYHYHFLLSIQMYQSRFALAADSM